MACLTVRREGSRRPGPAPFLRDVPGHGLRAESARSHTARATFQADFHMSSVQVSNAATRGVSANKHVCSANLPCSKGSIKNNDIEIEIVVRQCEGSAPRGTSFAP